MDFHLLKYVCLLWLASLAVAEPQQNTITNEIDDKIPEKPEPRQIGAVMPYTWIQPPQAVQMSAPAPSSWSASLSPPAWLTSSGQSLLSLLKPNVVGGRRSSLSNRLRNLMNALFYRRETSSPYMPSGSSYSYAFRPPPFGFGTGFSTSGLGSGLGSSLGSGLGGSGLGSSIGNQNMFGSASSYRPVVLPNYGSNPSDAWSNYKQYGSSSPFSGTSNWPSGSNSPSQSGAIWQSGSQSAGTGSQGYSSLGSSSYPSSYSGSGGSGSSSSGGGSGAGYQASASNNYPSNTSYQRSSVSTYSKPQTSVNTSVSSSVSSSSSSQSSSPGIAKSK